MGNDDWARYLILFLFLGVPFLRWVFTKLYQATQPARTGVPPFRPAEPGASRSDDEFERGFIHEPSRSEEEEVGHPDDEWEEIPFEPEDLEPAPVVVEVAPPRASTRPTPRPPRLRGSAELSRFLEELGVETRPPRTPPPVVPEVPDVPLPEPVVATPPSSLVSATPPVAGVARSRASKGLPGTLRRRELQKMIIWSELLAPPIALREKQPGEFD